VRISAWGRGGSDSYAKGRRGFQVSALVPPPLGRGIKGDGVPAGSQNSGVLVRDGGIDTVKPIHREHTPTR